MAFQKASRSKTKLRVAFAGPAGAGKTVTALQFAKTLGGRVALADSEGGSASKYGDLFDFDTECLTDFHPRNYIRLIRDAEAGGYATLITDSLSHEWVGKGGVMDMVDQAKDKFGDGWKKASPLHQELVDAILNARVNVIATLRSKMAYEKYEENGKTKIRKLGMAPVTREGTEYEFDFLFDLFNADGNGILSVSKSRAMGVIDVGDTVRRQDFDGFFLKLKGWAEVGAESPSPKSKPAPALATPSIFEQMGIACDEYGIARTALGPMIKELFPGITKLSALTADHLSALRKELADAKAAQQQVESQLNPPPPGDEEAPF